MEEEKRKRLEAIKDEVEELHPLLKLLLPKMPGVKNTEYTHGPNEMGADFLLSRFDETFGELDYIAVIAKVGKIDQPNISDVDRQIEESFIPKLFDSGKNSVNVNEVWVVTNAGISNGAKIKINDKYTGRKIHFIPGEKLARLIDKYAPNFWTAIQLQIGDYLNQLRLRNEEFDKSLSIAKNNADIYITSSKKGQSSLLPSNTFHHLGAVVVLIFRRGQLNFMTIGVNDRISGHPGFGWRNRESHWLCPIFGGGV